MDLLLTVDLTLLRSIAIKRINAEVEAFRLKYITPGDAQSMVYAEKAKEIERYHADVAAGKTIVDSDYPYAMIDANLYGLTLASAIQFIEYFAGEWEAAGPPSEEVRRAATVAVEMATSPAEIERGTVLDWTPVLNAIAAYHAA